MRSTDDEIKSIKAEIENIRSLIENLSSVEAEMFGVFYALQLQKLNDRLIELEA